jgi:WD40 repeat protein
MASYCLNEDTKLIVSGGDDGSLAVLLTRRGQPSSSSDSIFATAPVLLSRTHGSAVTACTLVERSGQIFIVTSGNDQWLRLWKVCIHGDDNDLDLEAARLEGGMVEVERVTKVKTNVADVSSMAVLENEDAGSKVLICGVGMEVVRLQWDT